MSEAVYSEFEKGERHALLKVRSFITQHGKKEVDAYCAQRLHDMYMDALPKQKIPANGTARGNDV